MYSELTDHGCYALLKSKEREMRCLMVERRQEELRLKVLKRDIKNQFKILRELCHRANDIKAHSVDYDGMINSLAEEINLLNKELIKREDDAE